VPLLDIQVKPDSWNKENSPSKKSKKEREKEKHKHSLATSSLLTHPPSSSNHKNIFQAGFRAVLGRRV
jgi:hypothetical protein